MAIGHELTGNPEYLNQVKLGSDFLLKNSHDPLYGGWHVAVNPDGKMKIGNKRLYGHAFVILALALAYRATKDQRYLDVALQTWQEIQVRFADGKLDRNKGYWQQAEALRAFMHHATLRGRSDRWARVTQMTEFIQTELLDQENGGWFSAATAECHRGLCADLQPDGYHMTALHYEAIRLAKTVR